MKTIIPFKKEILFNNPIEEITSISMDHHLTHNGYEITGDFLIEGEYDCGNHKTDTFHFAIPYLGYLEDHYNVEKVELEVDDFYYEIIDGNKLSIHIDILADKLTEKPLLEKEEEIPVRKEEKEEVVEERKEEKEETSLETILSTSLEEMFTTYKVYIVRETDTLSSILEKYQITEEELRKYNVINELSIGDKLIIPNEQS